MRHKKQRGRSQSIDFDDAELDLNKEFHFFHSNDSRKRKKIINNRGKSRGTQFENHSNYRQRTGVANASVRFLPRSNTGPSKQRGKSQDSCYQFAWDYSKQASTYDMEKVDNLMQQLKTAPSSSDEEDHKERTGKQLFTDLNELSGSASDTKEADDEDSGECCEQTSYVVGVLELSELFLHRLLRYQ
jgi:hypothetical protein